MFSTEKFDKTFKNIWAEFSEGFYTDVRENENALEIIVDIPGVEKKDIDISLDNRILTISAKREKTDCSKYKIISERRWSGEEKVSYRLGFPVEEKDISAELNLGVLTLKIPKTKTPVKKIEIT